MADYIINENGVNRPATDVETARIDAKNKAWEDDKPNRQLSQIREIRNQKLSDTDYLATSDNVLNDDMKNFRKSMRDIPQNYDSSKYDELLAIDSNGNLTHSVWSKP
tara:strand:- start:8 stop:328 length:321 start_codon:yes stop_codon:yes gene_type:complete